MTRPRVAIVLAISLAAGAAAAASQEPPPVAQPAEPATIYLMDQLVTGALPEVVLDEMKPLNTLDEVEALLKRHRLPFAWREAEVSSANINPQIAKQVAQLPPHEVFVAPQGPGWMISVVLSSRPATTVVAPPAPETSTPLAKPAKPAPPKRPARSKSNDPCHALACSPSS